MFQSMSETFTMHMTGFRGEETKTGTIYRRSAQLFVKIIRKCRTHSRVSFNFKKLFLIQYLKNKDR